MPRPGRRDHIIEVAIELFCSKGFHATGVDTIMRAAQVSKKTLYNHFRSKDELILAALQLRDERFRNWLMAEMERAATDPKGRLIAMFDALETWFQGEAFKGLGFSGCAFINASAEFPPQDEPAHRLSAEHKRRVVEYLTKLCSQAELAEPETVAEQLALLKEGAIVTAHVRNMPKAAQVAKQMARIIIANAESLSG